MRRFVSLSCLIMAVFATTFAALAQSPGEKGAAARPLARSAEMESQSGGMTAVPDVPTLTNAGSDFCTGAPLLTVPGGDVTDLVNNMTESAGDPVLDFAWGTPSNPSGYRTLWYKFSVDANSQLVIDTLGSNYDTVMAVYVPTNDNDPCNTLVRVTGNDDNNGFSSQVRLRTAASTTYYVEVADWQSAAPQPKSLRISLWTEPFPSKWVQLDNMPLHRTRHTAVVVGQDIYVLGGQTTVDQTPTLSNRLERFETDTGNWVRLADMPGGGYAGTDAVAVNGRIYIPAGFDGNKNLVNGQHWAYDIAANQWLTRTNAPWPGGVPFAWSAVIPSPAENGYYVAGGMSSYPPLDPSATTHNDVFFYSITNDLWIIRPSLPSGRYALTGALAGGKICIVGGLESTGSSSILLGNGACIGNLTSGDTKWTLTGNMTVPRYYAGSAVGPDGKWYVFGGVDGSGEAVSEIDVYDPTAGSWSALDITYDLGARRIGVNGPTIPARAWARGGFVGSALYAIGGNAMPESGGDVLSLVEKVFVPSYELRLPIVYKNFNPAKGPDDVFADAQKVTLNSNKYQNFDNLDDFYDVYYFDLTQTTNITARLTNIPLGSNYDLRVYNANKLLRGTGDNVGNTDEMLVLNGLPPDRYYVMVERVFPAGDPDTANYRLRVEN
ncbi:MAG: kelch repeat-containing protein [Anaerolineae bacterium]